MEDQDPPIDAFLRRDALDKAVCVYSMFDKTFLPDGNVVLNDILLLSDAFYQFLKGDNK